MAIDILRNHAIQAMPESVASRSTKVAPKAPEGLVFRPRPHDDSCRKWTNLYGADKKELFERIKFHLILEIFLFFM